MDEVTGWIKLSRKLLQQDWYLGEKFTKSMCWIDLLLLAEWRKERSFFIRGIRVVVDRGQVAMPLSELSRRWCLSVNTVRSRLREMVKDGRISLRANNVVTRITILNWEKYQFNETGAEHEPVEIIQENIEPLIETIPPDNDTEVEEIAPIIEEIPIEPVDPIVDAPDLPTVKSKKPEVDCDFVVRLFHDRCPSYPKVLKVSDKRKMKIRIRFEEMGYNFETLQQVFDKAEASKFMRGDNPRGWRADFDWIFKNGDNWTRILEGRYDDRTPKINIIPTTTNGIIEHPSHSPINGGGYSPTTASERQKLSVLATLAKIESEQGGGNIPTGSGS